MRASRLLSLLILLEERGRTTTAGLAARLEVSRRTVLRDITALGSAGVPIVTWPGPGGGVELLGGWRTAVGALTAEDAGGQWLAGQPLLARALGLATAGEAAPLGWLVIDPEPSSGAHVPGALLRDAARACREGLDLVLTLSDGGRVVHPSRLTLRAGRWWLGQAEAGEELPLDAVRRHRLHPRLAD